MSYVIKVTAFWGGVLYVSNVRQDWESGFGVKIRKYAKQFKTRAAAQEAIDSFTPAVKETKFEIEEA